MTERPLINDELTCPSEEAATIEYKNRILEMTGDENIDILIDQLKKEGTLSHSFKPHYDKTRTLVKKGLLENRRGSKLVPSRPLIKVLLTNQIIQYSNEIEKTSKK